MDKAIAKFEVSLIKSPEGKINVKGILDVQKASNTELAILYYEVCHALRDFEKGADRNEERARAKALILN